MAHRIVLLMGVTITQLFESLSFKGFIIKDWFQYCFHNDNKIAIIYKIATIAAPLRSHLTSLFLVCLFHFPHASHALMPTVSRSLFLHLTFYLALFYLSHHPCVILLFCWPLIDVQIRVRRARIQHNPKLRAKQTKNLSALHHSSLYSACNRKETKTWVFKNTEEKVF